jgi:hypothetical protein
MIGVWTWVSTVGLETCTCAIAHRGDPGSVRLLGSKRFCFMSRAYLSHMILLVYMPRVLRPPTRQPKFRRGPTPASRPQAQPAMPHVHGPDGVLNHSPVVMHVMMWKRFSSSARPPFVRAWLACPGPDRTGHKPVVRPLNPDATVSVRRPSGPCDYSLLWLVTTDYQNSCSYSLQQYLHKG